ncbi:unnamed protein product [Pleuronectes platessa]|uniref:Uncharacterized protein n=1 Tax=Pleuronectes platessa TaxID=8262 RepID=A0A9N7V3Z7_PLEPL|nr:unnamed protein product [Pleuronectes platessa]
MARLLSMCELKKKSRKKSRLHDNWRVCGSIPGFSIPPAEVSLGKILIHHNMMLPGRGPDQSDTRSLPVTLRQSAEQGFLHKSEAVLHLAPSSRPICPDALIGRLLT